jgi:diacylglycerol kinase (ATP)
VSRRIAIYNPAAGLARANRRLLARLGRSAGGLEVVATRGPGDGTRLAREAADCDELVVIGGDGTVAEVLNGMDRARQRLALLPSGHGNCLARDLGVGAMDAAFGALDGGAAVTLDLMRVRVTRADGPPLECLAASTLAVGYVAEVVRRGRTHLARLGRYAYTAAAVSTRPRRRAVGLVRDGTRRAAALTTLVVNNTAHLANFRTFHAARLDDGQLDVLEGDFGWWRQMVHNGAILAGSERFGPAALWQAAAIAITLDRPSLLMLDGELLPAVTGVEIACVPSAVRCRCAP